MTPLLALLAALSGPADVPLSPPGGSDADLVLLAASARIPAAADTRIDERAAPGAAALASNLRSDSGPTPLSTSELDGLAGGDGGVAVAVANQRLTAVNTGNRITADQVVTGSVSLDGNALSNFSGLGNIVVNTGNNNNLQSSLSVSIVTPPR